MRALMYKRTLTRADAVADAVAELSAAVHAGALGSLNERIVLFATLGLCDPSVALDETLTTPQALHRLASVILRDQTVTEGDLRCFCIAATALSAPRLSTRLYPAVHVAEEALRKLCSHMHTTGASAAPTLQSLVMLAATLRVAYCDDARVLLWNIVEALSPTGNDKVTTQMVVHFCAVLNQVQA